MFRTNLIQKINKDIFIDHFIADWLTGMLLIDMGGPLYLMPDKMSAYVLHENTQWTSLSAAQKQKQIKVIRKQYNEIFDFKYNKTFAKYL